jgi:hypothetical protein
LKPHKPNIPDMKGGGGGGGGDTGGGGGGGGSSDEDAQRRQLEIACISSGRTLAQCGLF